MCTDVSPIVWAPGFELSSRLTVNMPSTAWQSIYTLWTTRNRCSERGSEHRAQVSLCDIWNAVKLVSEFNKMQTIETIGDSVDPSALHDCRLQPLAL
jgi:hypothetical protein